MLYRDRRGLYSLVNSKINNNNNSISNDDHDDNNNNNNNNNNDNNNHHNSLFILDNNVQLKPTQNNKNKTFTPK